MKPEEYSWKEIEEFPYAKISIEDLEERRAYHPKDMWEFEIGKLLAPINPIDYFRTTGEAIIKLRKLEHDVYALVGNIRRILNVFEKLRGTNAYLETQWNEGRLLIKIKNPRKNKESKVAALEENFAYGPKKKREPTEPTPTQPTTAQTSCEPPSEPA